ncbi:MAG: CoA-acylating methylmalonate-semialdehyde dehydrogenase [Fimbriimonadaceae bacterium]
MSPTLLDVPSAPNLIGGQWSVPNDRPRSPVHNPSTGEVIASTPHSTGHEVAMAVDAAVAAFCDWRPTTPAARAAILFRFRQRLEDEFQSLAALVMRENGKTRQEAAGDVRRGIEVVEFACGIPHLLKGDSLPQVADGIDGITTREPIGVCAGITPFNFPAMVPMWMFPVAIACGNSFILKPSEKVPLTAVRLGELLLEAGLPTGVFNIVHGGSEVVDALCSHPRVSAISFVGSSAVAQHVYALACKSGKRVQAAGGAKNVLVVMPDADVDGAVKAIVGSAFGCAGQRCMAGSLLFAVDMAASGLRDRLVEALNRLSVADPSANPDVGMGPVIDRLAQERVNAWITRTENESAELVRDGRPGMPKEGFFVGPTLFDSVSPGMTLFDEEVFGPVLAVCRPRNLDDAIELAHRSGYGNGATIFTASGASARHFAHEIQCGMVGINVGVPAPMPIFSFTGWRNSFYGDLHTQGTEGVAFYTRQKTVLSRWEARAERRQGW